MTIDEAIKHCKEVAEEKDKSVELYKAVKATEGLITKCEDCAKEHRQLAEWLKELKAYRDNRGISIEDFEEAMDALQQHCEEYKAKMEVDKLCD